MSTSNQLPQANRSDLPRSAPEAQGISSEAIVAFVDGAEAAGLELHGLMILRHGNVVAEGWWKPYRAEAPHILYSLSKSFTSTAAGFAIAEGRFKLDDPVISFFPDDLPAEVSDNLRAMTVRNLLTMATGHEKEPQLWAAQDGNWPRQFLAQPVEHKPGTHFLYNTPATYMVSAIVEKTTGTGLRDYLTPRLFEPLGISPGTWETDPHGVATGGYGLNLKTEDIARFGQLYLQKGVWNGKRLLSEEWIDLATSKQVENGTDPNNDWNQGYGFQFWRCRHDAYRGDGAFGQFCIVMPPLDAVIAITSGVGNMGAVLNLCWQHLLPAMGDGPLPENATAQRRLTDRLASLTMPAPQGKASAPIADSVSGKTYRFAENDQKVESLSVTFTDGGLTLTVKNDDGTHTVPAGFGSWREGETTFLRKNIRPGWPPLERCPVAGQAAWTDNNTLTIKVCYTETPFAPTITLRFDGDRLHADLKGNVGFSPAERPTLEGQAA